MFNFKNLKDRKQKELEKKLEQSPTMPPMPIETGKQIEDETDDEKDELEDDIVVTHL